MILNLVRYDHPAFTGVAQRFDFANPAFDPVGFAKNLAETMLAFKGLGLAAPQVGVPFRIVAVTGSPITVMYNPRVVDAAQTTHEMDEACLTLPGVQVMVARAVSVRVRFFQPNGEAKTELFTGMTARVVQHELDHLDGVTILDRAVGLRKQFAQKRWSKVVKRTGGEPARIPTMESITI